MISHPHTCGGKTPGTRMRIGGTLTAVALMLSTGTAWAQVTPVAIESGDNSLFSSRVLTTHLDNPWAMAWGPDDMIWVTERTNGQVTRVDPVSGAKQVLLTIDDIFVGPQHEGLLGLALHPELMQGSGNDFVYLAHTVNRGTDDAPERRAQIVRYTYDANLQQLVDPEIVVQDIPAGDDHNAGRLLFGPDGKLYYSIGELGHNFGRNYRKPNLALALPSQDEIDNADWRTYQGKILRLNTDGSIPDDNPELDGVRSHIYSYGHRNPQGIAFGPDGTLYEVEHGPATDDELNIITPGGNYGWPAVAGYIDDQNYVYINWSEAPEDVDRNARPLPDSVPQFAESTFEDDMVDPIATYFTVGDDYPIGQICGYICDPTIAPSSVTYYAAGEDGIAEWDNSVLITTLKHGTLYVQKLSEDGQSAEGLPVAWLSSQNRYRDVLVAPDNRTVYIATDDFGSAAQKFGEGLDTSVMHNPGAILMFTYDGEGNSGIATVQTNHFHASPAGQAAVQDDAGHAAPEVEETAQDAAVSSESDLAAVVNAGAPKYAANCAGCHGPSGQGGAGAVLADNGNLADASFVAETLIHGFGYMPPFGHRLSDEDIAQIGTYIRNSFGNDYGILTEEQVASER